MKTEDVASLLSISTTTVRRMVRNGVLKLYKQSKCFDITEESVEEILKRKQIRPPVWKKGNNCV